MQDIIVVAGGNSKRNLELANKFDQERYQVKICQSSDSFRNAISEDNVILVLLLYPDESDSIKEIFARDMIKGDGFLAAIIFVSSSSVDNERLRSLRYQADEFFIEPVSARDILEIIGALSVCQGDRRKSLTIGDITLDRTSLTVSLRSVKLRLHPIQVRVLEFLMLNPGRAFTRQQIKNRIWAEDDSIDERTIDVNIGRIRDALKHKVTVNPIRTIRGVGYAFDEHFGKFSSAPKKGRKPERLRSIRGADRVRSA
jgi:two-component system phosphate regulon response regulator PhoB